MYLINNNLFILANDITTLFREIEYILKNVNNLIMGYLN